MGRLSKVFKNAKESSSHQENESTNSLNQESIQKQMEETSSFKNETTEALDNESGISRNNEITKVLDNESGISRNNEITKALDNESKKSLNKKLVNLNFKVDVEIRRKIKQYAAAHDQSLKEVFERAIEFYMEHHS